MKNAIKFLLENSLFLIFGAIGGLIWANVNPEVSHPRWSQARERTLSGQTIPTQLFNGYTEFVAHLYKNKKDEKLFR